MRPIDDIIQALVCARLAPVWNAEQDSEAEATMRHLCDDLMTAVRADEATHHVSYWHRLYASLSSDIE